MAKKFLDIEGLQHMWDVIKTYISTYVSNNSKYEVNYTTDEENKNYKVFADESKNLYVNVPWNDTAYTFTKGENGYINIDDSNESNQSVEVYTHPITPGNKHIPTGGGEGQFLKWNADGTAMWSNVSKSDIGLDGDSEGVTFTDVSLLGISTAPTAPPGTNTKQIATTEFVQTEINTKLSATDALIYKGTIGTEGTIQTLPSTYEIGWTYKVVTTGMYANNSCEVGDMIIALVDRNGSGNLNSDWTVVQNNIDLVSTFGSTGLIKNGSSINDPDGYTACPIINGVPYYKNSEGISYDIATDSIPGLITVGYSETSTGSVNDETYVINKPVLLDGSNAYINIDIMTTADIGDIII